MYVATSHLKMSNADSWNIVYIECTSDSAQLPTSYSYNVFFFQSAFLVLHRIVKVWYHHTFEGDWSLK